MTGENSRQGNTCRARQRGRERKRYQGKGKWYKTETETEMKRRTKNKKEGEYGEERELRSRVERMTTRQVRKVGTRKHKGAGRRPGES